MTVKIRLYIMARESKEQKKKMWMDAKKLFPEAEKEGRLKVSLCA